MWYVCDVLYAVLYVRVICFVVLGCAVSRSIKMFSIVMCLVLLICDPTKYCSDSAFIEINKFFQRIYTYNHPRRYSRFFGSR